MPTLLKDLRVNEVSSVDNGAGEGVRIMLMKRLGADDLYKGFDQGWADWFSKSVGTEDAAVKSSKERADAYLKRDFSADDRKRLASSGAALPDGSFPIENASDLENAVHAYGRASDKPKAKAHIIAHAKTLGCTDKLPDGWVGKSLTAATAALLKSAWSIFEDKAVVDKASALTETFKQFDDHVSAELDALALTKAKEASMTEEDKKAAEAKAKQDAKDKEHEDTKKALELAKREIAVLKLSPTHQDYMDKQTEWSDRDKQNFLDKSPDERDAHMAKNPIAKRALPADVQKALDAAAADRVILKALQEKDEIATFAKRAVGLGLQEVHGEILRKAYAGDAEAIKKLEQLMKGLTEQVRTGKVFAEFGSAGGGDASATAYERLQKLAAERRDIEIKAGKKCSPEQAFVKVYTDPANKALKEEHDRDEVTKRARFAA
jgi:hypothetical protein